MLRVVEVTGADDTVDQAVLERLSGEFPFVEWGILMGATTLVTKPTRRNPSLNWVAELQRRAAESDSKLRLSIHCCGPSWIGKLCTGERPERLSFQSVERLQLNMRIGSAKPLRKPVAGARGKYSNFAKYIAGETPAAVADGLRACVPESVEIVLQVHPDGAVPDEALELARCISESREVSLLFDPSEGSGTEKMDSWPQPASGFSCGYVGGLNSLNVEPALHQVHELVGEREDVWIGMESGARNNEDANPGEDGPFDPVRVRTFLSQAESWGND